MANPRVTPTMRSESSLRIAPPAMSADEGARTALMNPAFFWSQTLKSQPLNERRGLDGGSGGSSIARLRRGRGRDRRGRSEDDFRAVRELMPLLFGEGTDL